ncbi:MAG: DoxX family membrane protein [Armatimonadota bacterium]|nr:DoxX family membrane protein [Armatimonadota bacterium]MDR7450577.1 DoxX family membrane protein [Armatimonadota bacterium]MDR7466290.1 DoxX family membrane protein [Armatimonadota bacterium]MDR7493011.1 DoxX family membrane protein [Armatimonadota bacterium]MDR7498232.1 DoxX family membrane protein [Armatimonadota bacterium]
MAKVESALVEVYSDPPFARTLFSTTRFAWLWAAVRIWLGWQWIEAARHKVGVEAWTGTGMALKGFWERAIQVPPPPARPPIAFDWYRTFIQYLLDTQSYTWFAKLVAYGELAVGIALIVGAFVGIAAFFGAFMNWNFMMAGTASTNPLLFTAAMLLILSWKVAGHYGLDRVLLPLLGTPWRPGKAFIGRTASAAS